MGNRFIIFLAAALVGLIFFIIVSLNIGGQNTPAEEFFVIKRGDNVLQIASNLERQGYIKSRFGFIWEALISGNFKKMKAGRYQIEKGQPYQELIIKFTKAQSAPVSISIAPGKTSQDIALLFESAHLFRKDEFLNLILDTSKEKGGGFNDYLLKEFPFLSDRPEGLGLEGYLFPDTYLINSSASAQETVEQILSNFSIKMNQDLLSQAKKQKRAIFQVITMASLLEKEVNNYQDKQIVAGILWKRADNNLPLEVDSTLLYFSTSLHPDLMEKNVDSPYNTYKYAGLPLGPICNPGLESIRAALYPQETDYWFYSSAPNGETIFAKTLGQHLINKARYLTQ